MNHPHFYAINKEVPPAIAVDHAAIQIPTDADGQPMAAPAIPTIIHQANGICIEGIPVKGQKTACMFQTAGNVVPL